MLSVSEPDLPTIGPAPNRSRRVVTRIALVLAMILALLAPGAESTAQTQQANPPTVSDELLLVKVRLAGLWEIPASMLAMQKGTTQQVKDVGFALLIDHGRLDGATRDLAAKMGIPLPDTPMINQQDWLQEMLHAKGQAFDQSFANRLRVAHGQVLAIIAQVRAATHDARIRGFSIAGNQAVMRHISLLESTGVVNPAFFPAASIAGSGTPPDAQLDLGPTQLVLLVALFLLTAGGLFYLLRRAKRGRGRISGRPADVRAGGSHG